MEYRPKNFNEFANLIHTTKQEVEELREDNEELERENLCLRNQIFELKQRNRRLEISMKKATAENSDDVNIFNNYSIPQIFKGRVGRDR